MPPGDTIYTQYDVFYYRFAIQFCSFFKVDSMSKKLLQSCIHSGYFLQGVEGGEIKLRFRGRVGSAQI